MFMLMLALIWMFVLLVIYLLTYPIKGHLLLSMKRPEAAAVAFRGAQELRADIRSYQGSVYHEIY